ncbi:MAG TPA: transcriptional repressor LexA [Firmicutes bacterium]|nr:transcriptional repressor LexA [Bacillales bacterium]HJA40266.1 transcriptional repressor LexA [Bacillota bacterium]
MEKLTKRQKEIYLFLEHFIYQNGYPPSVREIGEAIGLASSSTVHGHLDRLEKKGFIRRDPTKPRAIELLQEDAPTQQMKNTIFIPILGKVTAGQPITAIEDIESYFPLPTEYAHLDGQIFMLHVVGDSMINAGIFDGDLIIVKQQTTAVNGDIVVAMTEENEVTVKRFYKEDDYFRLQPENDALEPILLKQIEIIGKVIGVFRNIS